jgi:acyl transferase domain-containing protein
VSVVEAHLEAHLREVGASGTVVGSLGARPDERTSLLVSLGQLWASGVAFRRAALFPAGGTPLRVPGYPWQLVEYWPDIESLKSRRRRWTPSASKLLGQHVELSAHAGTHYWHLDLAPHDIPWLADYRVHHRVALPPAAILEVARAAAVERFGDAARVEALTFMEPLILPDGVLTIQTCIEGNDEGGALRILARMGNATWTEHARARVRAAGPTPAPQPVSVQALRARCREAVSPTDHARRLADAGVACGAAYESIREAWRAAGEALAELRLPDHVADTDSFQLHPALLEVALQMASVAAGTPGWAPSAATQLAVYRPLGATTWVHAALRSVSNGEGPTGDLVLFDNTGRVTLAIEGLQLEPVAREGLSGAISDRAELRATDY